MTTLALLFCVAISGFGLLGLASPDRAVAFARRAATPRGVYAAAAVRVVMGVVFIVAAPESRAPALISVLGVVTVGAGLATLLIGVERIARLIDWWESKGKGLARAQGAFALCVGLALGWVMWPV